MARSMRFSLLAMFFIGMFTVAANADYCAGKPGSEDWDSQCGNVGNADLCQMSYHGRCRWYRGEFSRGRCVGQRGSQDYDSVCANVFDPDQCRSAYQRHCRWSRK